MQGLCFLGDTKRIHVSGQDSGGKETFSFRQLEDEMNNLETSSAHVCVVQL